MWAVEPVVYLVRCRVVTRSQWCAIADTVHVDMIVRARNIMHAKRKNCVGQMLILRFRGVVQPRGI